MDKDASAQRLWEHLGRVPDHRGARGKRHPLAAVLALAVAAMAAGGRSLYGMWQWGRELSVEQVRALGFTREKTPSVSTLHKVFTGLDVEAFEAAIAAWAREESGGVEVVSLDGKGLRGIHGEELPGVKLVAAYSDKPGLVLGQEGGKG